MSIRARLSVVTAAVLVLLTVAAPTALAVDDPDTEIARRHFTRGAQLYDENKYEAALAEFEAARTVRPLPALDFNIARACDRLERLDCAISAYDRWLASKPTDDGGAGERVTVLRQRRGTKPVVPATVAVAQAAAPIAASPPRRRIHIGLPAGFAALTAVTLGVGLGLYFHAGQRHDDFAAQGCGAQSACNVSGARTEERVGIGLLATAGVVAVVDVALWAAWGVRPRERPIARRAP